MRVDDLLAACERADFAITARSWMPRHVHLSPDVDTARTVGARRGRPVVLTVGAGDLHRAGHPFFRAENGVWLTDSVPADRLARLS